MLHRVASEGRGDAGVVVAFLQEDIDSWLG